MVRVINSTPYYYNMHHGNSLTPRCLLGARSIHQKYSGNPSHPCLMLAWGSVSLEKVLLRYFVIPNKMQIAGH